MISSTKKFFIALMLFLPAVASAQPNLVTTIKPLGLIANDIAGNHANVEVLLPDSASPHDYALRPSDLKKISAADAVFWVGPELELFLEKLLGDADNAVRLTTYPGMPVRYFDEGAHGHDDHDHHGHSHDGIDGHIWLGPDQSIVIAQAVKDKLVKLDPSHAKDYESNYARFKADLESAKSSLETRLSAIDNKGYFLFHDAYGYFEDAFKLNSLGHLTINPERKPGAKTLVAIRGAIKKGQAQCVFSEPQFNPAMVSTLVKGTDAKVLVLDPMATDLKVETNQYVDFLNQLGSQYLACFSEI
ncbi:High-affinity zinc uptake system protein ZnuA precursor [Grimontia celer]|uniref:High-affinity zinc uptake system protein ZnuA n=1 Tax=Grimontia celer TaxID=1796497 RepID=A0A128F128_9GAMM|nr:zinc ABC transporter substrate-binding protein ZnuA [Grimontia celer]CZF79981.1 High-affinity zinc uptake system protein ZnuA precursor [Grimontia celer]